jgi:hypothetical protein
MALVVRADFHCDGSRRVKVNSRFGPKTEAALLKLAEGLQALSGFDNDAAGAALHKRLARLLPGATRLAPPTRVEGANMPCKDWLDVLNTSKGASSPAMVPPRPAATDNGAGTADRSMQAPHLDEPEIPGFKLT